MKRFAPPAAAGKGGRSGGARPGIMREKPLMRVKGGARGKRNAGPALIPRVPVRSRFNPRIKNVIIDTSAALRPTGRRGLRLTSALDLKITREEAYQKWRMLPGHAMGTRPEWAVYAALIRLGLHSPESTPPGYDFQYQVPLLGGRHSGGAIADIVIMFKVPQIVIRVQGEYFHFIDDAKKESDIIQRLALENAGYVVVDILAQDTLLQNRCDEVVGYALNGYELDESGRLGIFR